MTPLQKRCQELLPVIQAGAEGKVIQFKSSCGKWIDKLEDKFCGFHETDIYRIKPEPHYRPFTPEEAIQHVMRRVRNKHSGNCRTVSWIGKTDVLLCSQNSLSFAALLEFYEFDDGSPCGVLVEDGQ
ncbi:MAG: hypothetical protein E6Q97_35285 [Desulfurellales bacterium]|nr:MAG: hypothetical protein E6Q97_35285 [Desulfurellales bacterium]